MKELTKAELQERNAVLSAEVGVLREQVAGLRQQMSFMNERHEAAALMLGDALINNRMLAQQQLEAHDHPPEPGALSAREAQELGMA